MYTHLTATLLLLLQISYFLCVKFQGSSKAVCLELHDMFDYLRQVSHDGTNTDVATITVKQATQS